MNRKNILLGSLALSFIWLLFGNQVLDNIRRIKEDRKNREIEQGRQTLLDLASPHVGCYDIDGIQVELTNVLENNEYLKARLLKVEWKSLLPIWKPLNPVSYTFQLSGGFTGKDFTVSREVVGFKGSVQEWSDVPQIQLPDGTVSNQAQSNRPIKVEKIECGKSGPNKSFQRTLPSGQRR